MKKILNPLSVTEITDYFHRRFNHDRILKWHSHPFWEINYILSGSMEMVYDNQILMLKEGDFFIGEPNSFHNFHVINNKPIEFIVIQFMCNDIPLIFEPRVYTLSNIQEQLFMLLIHELETFERTYNTDITNSTYFPYTAKILLEICLIQLINRPTEINLIKNKKASIFNAAASFIRINYDKKLTVNDVAKHCYVCPTTLKKVFSEFAGCGVNHYIMDLKIANAKQALINNVSITEIAQMLNFSSTAYFTNSFKKIVGITPSEFKKHNTALYS